MADQTFEKAMSQLEQIVHDLETGDLTLEKALKKFEQGIKLSRFCSNKLDETEKRINILMQDQNGKVIDKPFILEQEPENGR